MIERRPHFGLRGKPLEAEPDYNTLPLPTLTPKIILDTVTKTPQGNFNKHLNIALTDPDIKARAQEIANLAPNQADKITQKMLQELTDKVNDFHAKK